MARSNPKSGYAPSTIFGVNQYPTKYLDGNDYEELGRYLSVDYSVRADLIRAPEGSKGRPKWLIRFGITGYPWTNFDGKRLCRALSVQQLDRLISVLLTVRARIVQEDRTVNPFPTEKYVVSRGSKNAP